MKKIYLISLLLALISFSPIDYDRALIQRVEGLMKDSPTTKSYTYKGKGWFEFTDESGLKWQRNFGDTRTHGGLKPKKIISIDLRTIDTTGYSTMFTELSTVHIGNASIPPIGSHFGNQGLAQLTGQYYEQGLGDYAWMTQQRAGTYYFDNLFRFENRFYPFGVCDLDSNAIDELVGDTLGSIISFELYNNDLHDIRLKNFWSGKNGSVQVPRIKDLDGDGKPEIICQQFGYDFDGTKIIKYNILSHQLESVYQIMYPHNPGFRGYWAVRDFDLDGKQEFATANMDGEVFLVEHVQGDSNYAITFVDTTRDINAYFHTEGNDLDGNGRPECFIGSDNTSGLNNIAVYETIGDNKFEVSLWIELYPVGSFSWQWIWTGDIDGDGKDEITFSSSSIIVILKAVGINDYKVMWYKRFNTGMSHRLFDVDNDGKKEILVSLVEGGIHKTKIYSFKKTTSVKHETLEIPFTFTLCPTVASSTVQIELISNKADNFMLILSSSTGKMISEKKFETTPKQKLFYNISTSSLSAGIYYVSVYNRSLRVTKKILVIH